MTEETITIAFDDVFSGAKNFPPITVEQDEMATVTWHVSKDYFARTVRMVKRNAV